MARALAFFSYPALFWSRCDGSLKQDSDTFRMAGNDFPLELTAGAEC